MTASLNRLRVRRDIEVLCAADLELADLFGEIDASLQRALVHDGSLFTVLDPAVCLPAAAYRFGTLTARTDSSLQRALCDHPAAAVTIERMAAERRFALLGPAGADASDVDELLVIATRGRRVWGMLALAGERASYSAEDLAFASGLSCLLAGGIRNGVIRSVAMGGPGPLTGPATLVFDEHGAVAGGTPGADAWLAEIEATGPGRQLVATLVHRVLAGADRSQTTCRVSTGSGAWAVLRAEQLIPVQPGAAGQVAVSFSEASPPDTIPLLTEAMCLTPREQQLVDLCLRGLDTRAIGEALNLSVFTIQDHFRAIFAKAGVHSRAELLALLSFGRGNRPATIDGAAVQALQP